jgi:cyclohexanecarboxyl-CoA dehydrogenase
MDFNNTEEHEQFRLALRKFAQKEIRPGYARGDATGEFPWEQARLMGAQGLLGLGIPEPYGGQGLDLMAAGIAAEEISRADFNCVWLIIHAVTIGQVLARNGTEAQRRHWLPRVARGEAVSAICVTEPGGGSDAAAGTTRAVRSGEGYVLTGEKTSISLGTEAQVAVVLAKTNPRERSRGVTAFLVPLDTPKVRRSRFDDLGNRAIGRSSLYFDDVWLPEEARLGEEGKGFQLIMHEFDCTRALIALQCLGAAEASLDETIDYVRERRAFGQPLARFEGVSFPIAEFATYLEAARLLCYKTLWLRSQGAPHTKEAAMCKWWVPRLAVEVIHQCLLFHGHVGFSKDLPFQQRLRDVIGLEIGDGTKEIQQIVIARELIGREYLPYRFEGKTA